MKFLLFCALLTTPVLFGMENSNPIPEKNAEWIISHPKFPSDMKNLIYCQTLLNLKSSPKIKSLHPDTPLIFYKTNFSNLQSNQIDSFLALGFIAQQGKDSTYYQPKNFADLITHQANIYHVQTIENNLDWTKIDDQHFKVYDKRDSWAGKIEFSQALKRFAFIDDLISLENIDLFRGQMFAITVDAYCPFKHKNSLGKKGLICKDEAYSNKPFIFFKVSTKRNNIYDQLIFYYAVNQSFGFFGSVDADELPTQTNSFFTSLNNYKKYLKEKNWVLNDEQTKLANDAYAHITKLKEKADEPTLQKAQEFLKAFKKRTDKIKILWLTQNEETKQNPFKQLHELVNKISNNNNN